MTTYRHREYWKFEMWWKHIVVTINDCYGAISTLEIPNHIWLLALWFEEVVEEKDWIDSAIKEMEQYFTYNETGICLTSMPPQYPRYNKTDLRQVLEKHMPKQNKITRDVVTQHFCKSKFITNYTAVEILHFLRTHDLLEE